jgi:hypothetical protein
MRKIFGKPNGNKNDQQISGKNGGAQDDCRPQDRCIKVKGRRQEKRTGS